MAGLLEIYNPDGSLRFSSQRFTIFKYLGEQVLTKSVDTYDTKPSKTWVLWLTVRVPASTRPNSFVFFPYLRMSLIQRTTEYEITIRGNFQFPTAYTKEQAIAECYRPAFIIGT